MASTTKKRKSKVKESNGPLDILEPNDLRQLENLSKDVIISQKDMLIEEQYLRNLKLEFELFQQKLIKQNELVKTKAEKYENLKVRYSTYRNEIGPKYGLKEGEPLGYNPDTGEIVR